MYIVSDHYTCTCIVGVLIIVCQPYVLGVCTGDCTVSIVCDHYACTCIVGVLIIVCQPYVIHVLGVCTGDLPTRLHVMHVMWCVVLALLQLHVHSSFVCRLKCFNCLLLLTCLLVLNIYFYFNLVLITS